MSEMTATFDPQSVVDALEEHRKIINEGMFKQFVGDDEGALHEAIHSINLLTETIFGLLGEENRRELRQLTADTHNRSTYFGLDDDEEWCDAWDAEHPEFVNANN